MTKPIYYINAGSDGTFTPTKDLSTTSQQVDEFFQFIVDNDRKKIAVHFHGGLVNEKSGLNTAKMMKSVFESGDIQPLTFIWETGMFETIRDNLDSIHKTKLFKYLIKTVLKTAGKKIGIELPGARGMAEMSDEELQQELLKPDPFSSFMRGARSADSLENEIDETFLESELQREFEVILQNDILTNELVDIPEDEEMFLVDDEEVFEAKEGARGFISIKLAIKLAKITLCVIKRYYKKRFHGLYPTVMEEVIRKFYVADLGAWVWKGMKNKAENMWKVNDGRSGAELYAGRYFLEKLAEIKKTNPELEVSLVGHSAGSIAICHLMAANEQLENPVHFENIFFLAPACTVKLFHDEILTRENRFTNFRMFTMHDDYEVKDQMIPFIYTRSLLYLVSGSFEIPDKCTNESILGLERNLHGAKPYDLPFEVKVSEYINQGKRMINSVTPDNNPNGERSESRKHGDFDNDTATQLSLIHLIR